MTKNLASFGIWCLFHCNTKPFIMHLEMYCDTVHISHICSRSWFKSVWFVCLSCATGIGLTLNGVQYTNNSVVNITDIGTGSAALYCTTTYIPCCFSGPPPGTHWYFPNGSRVDRFDTLPYYRIRIDASRSPPGAILLYRNPGATTTGVFRCEIHDAIGAFQSIYVGIYTTTTGESCTLKRNMFV